MGGNGVVYRPCVTGARTEERGVVEVNIRQFERGIRQGRMLRLKDATHGGFVSDPAQQRSFVPVTRQFLLKNAR